MEEIIIDKDEDWEKRVLCSDGNCIGTIGSDGRCKECGKPYEGELPAGFGAASIIPAQAEDKKTAASTAVENQDSDDEWDKRVLCSDGACIGVIGHDGRCRECGKPLQ